MLIFEFLNSGKRVVRDEYEVIEKPNSYEVVATGKKIKKSNIDVLHANFSTLSMYSLDGNPQKFIDAILEYKRKEICDAEIALTKLKNDMISISQTYRGYYADYIVGDLYCHTGFLKFCVTGNNRVVGNDEPSIVISPKKIGVLYSGKDFVRAIERGDVMPDSGKICMVYITGKATNLSIEGYSSDCPEACEVTLEKFKEICIKTRVEVNFWSEA